MSDDTITLINREQDFIRAYLEAIDFTETGEDGQPAPGSELDYDYKRRAVIDCLAFFNRIVCYLDALDDLDLDDLDLDAQAGHDFWLTRNGHGTGFWDREDIYGETYAEMFTELAKSFGETWPEWEDGLGQ